MAPASDGDAATRYACAGVQCAVPLEYVVSAVQDAQLLSVDVDAKPDTLDGRTHRVRVLRVYDGDTCTVGFFDGTGSWHCRKTRLLGVDAPEKKPMLTTPHRAAHMQAAAATRACLVHQLAAERFLAWASFAKADKYGRDLLTLRVVDGRNLNEFLITRCLALSYTGGAKTDWSMAHLTACLRGAEQYARESHLTLEKLVELSAAYP